MAIFRLEINDDAARGKKLAPSRLASYQKRVIKAGFKPEYIMNCKENYAYMMATRIYKASGVRMRVIPLGEEEGEKNV